MGLTLLAPSVRYLLIDSYFSIADPNTRYVNLNTKIVSPHQVAGYYLSDRPFLEPTISLNGKAAIIENAEAKSQKKNFFTGSLKRSGK